LLKEDAVNKTLDRYEYNMDIRGSAEIEIVTKRELSSSPADVSNAELKGQSYMVKISSNLYDIFEPYIKIGTSILEVKWVQHDNNVKVESNPGLVWTMGFKNKLWENKDYGVKLTIDAQYRKMNLDVDTAMIEGSTSTASAQNETFDITEWQVTLLASKRFILPIRMKDYYIVPYTGITYSQTEIDVNFTQSTSNLLYSTYDASDKEEVGLVLGCDIMPSLLSYYLLNFEVRLINETAFTIGGTVKF